MITEKINTNKLTIDNLNLNDYIIKNLKFYLKIIDNFKNSCINPNTKKLLTDKEIKDLKQQLENMELRFILELLKTANLKYPTDWNLNLYNKIQKQIKDRGLKNE